MPAESDGAVLEQEASPIKQSEGRAEDLDEAANSESKHDPPSPEDPIEEVTHWSTRRTRIVLGFLFLLNVGLVAFVVVPLLTDTTPTSSSGTVQSSHGASRPVRSVATGGAAGSAVLPGGASIPDASPSAATRGGPWKDGGISAEVVLIGAPPKSQTPK
jgi:hypothetical protein